MELISRGKYGLTIKRGAGARIGKESTVFYHLKKLLNAQGEDWVSVNKVPGLNSIPYALRTRKGEAYIYDNYYCTRAIEKDYNRGEDVDLSIWEDK